MRSWGLHPVSLQHTGPEVGNDQELQVDIMRFLAILALCLMAIFSLVQSLAPQVSPLGQAAASVPPASDRELRELEQRRQRLERELHGLRAEKTLTAQALAQGRGQLRALETQVRQASARLRRMQAKAVPARPLANEAVVVSRKPGAPASRAPTRPLAAPTPPAPKVSSASPVPNRDQNPAAKPAATGGTVLRFASEAALRHLVGSGSVGFFALTPSGGWRLRVSGRGLDFVASPPPKSYHEMAPDTVPATFLRTFAARQVPVTWGVTLPRSTHAQLRQLLAVAAGKELVIQEDGTVLAERTGGSL